MNLPARLGGVLLAPRAVLRHLPEQTGARDGAHLLALYALAVALPALGRALAGTLALGDPLGLLQGVVPLVPWLVCGLAVEWSLGRARAHRTALCMVPLLLVATLAHLLDLGGPRLLGPADFATALGGAASLALALAVRPVIPPAGAAERRTDLSPGTSPAPPAPTPDLSSGPSTAPPPAAHAPTPDLSSGPSAAPPPAPPAPTPDLSSGPSDLAARATHLSFGPAPRVAGLLLLALVAASAARDVRDLARVWPTLAPLAPGEPLPRVSLALLDRGDLTLDALPPVPHVLVFWTTWCGVCEREMPTLRALHRRWQDRGLRLVLVNADQGPDQAALARAYRASHTLEDLEIALDPGRAREALRVRVYPHFVFVDRRGEVARAHEGSLGERTLESAIEGLFD
ncbi:MAG: TlpA family protein disulfide reductase [Myxococcales bacterium]|nr:TlpA family protein disulfide reductase [Myxococcales bacterium]